MTWEIHIPVSDRPLDPAAIGALPQAIPDPEQRATARSLLEAAHQLGVRNTADLADAVAGWTEPDRRDILELARRHAGLPSTAEVEEQAAHDAFQRNFRALTVSQPDDGVPPICAAEGCRAQPIDPASGLLAVPGVRRWHCAAHEHLAEPGDLEPRAAGLAIDAATGALVDLAERDAEQRRAEREQQRREAEREQQQHERAEEAERERLRQDAVRQKLDREIPPGFARPDLLTP